MSFGMSMSMTQRQSIQQKIQVQVQMPTIQWSLVQAFDDGDSGPPPYTDPTYEEEVFTPRLKLELRKLAGFDALDHLARLRAVDQANKVFHFAYTRGEDQDGREVGYYKIPLLRDYNQDTDDIKLRVSAEECVRAIAIQTAVGQMERIARAVQYYGLYRTVVKHLRKMHATLHDTVLVSVDRGGRLPCELLLRALALPSMQSLKINQGGRGDGLDEERLDEFAARATLRGRHVLFVDSTVDSGRQINAIKEFFDNPSRKIELGHRSWSIVGSNENGQNLADNHQNVNWGVDPDSTFEDKPQLMGVDYAPGSYTKVVECPSDASRAIRKCLFAVPEGFVYDADDIDKQIETQRKAWTAKKSGVKEARIQAKLNSRVNRRHGAITRSKGWQKLIADHTDLPDTDLPIPCTTPQASRADCSLLIIGNGRSGKQTIPDAAARFIAESLAPLCSLMAGTSAGNPGAVLQAALHSPAAAIRLYQPEYARHNTNTQFGGAPVTFVGPDKEDMRRQMVADANAVLVLGGASGTLREVLLALEAGRIVYLIEGYGPVATYLLRSKRIRAKPHLRVCSDLPSAVRQVAEQLAA